MLHIEEKDCNEKLVLLNSPGNIEVISASDKLLQWVKKRD